VEIRVLTFEGCPNCDATATLVQQVVSELGLDVTVDHVQVQDESDAEAKGFFGSPSVQIDGRDIEPERHGGVPTFGCRLYVHEGRRSGVPPKELIAGAIQKARRSAGPRPAP
jgi:hypothetical protein